MPPDDAAASQPACQVQGEWWEGLATRGGGVQGYSRGGGAGGWAPAMEQVCSCWGVGVRAGLLELPASEWGVSATGVWVCVGTWLLEGLQCL